MRIRQRHRPTVAGATMSAEEQFAKLRLVVEVAEEVWGSA